MTDSFANRYLRMLALATGRMTLWWIKYLDKLISKRAVNMPKGYAVTFIRDEKTRDDKELLAEMKELALTIRGDDTSHS